MPQYLDQYFYVDHRDTNLVKSFLEYYLPERFEDTTDYEIEQNKDQPKILFDNLNDFLVYLESNNNCEYSFYWHNLNEKSAIMHAMLFYTNDGGIIYGISILGRYPEERQSLLVFKDLKLFLNSIIGCITSEEPPPNNLHEFLTFANDRYPQLINV